MAGRCVEMVGGAGFTKDFPVEKFYRDSKIGEFGCFLAFWGVWCIS